MRLKREGVLRGWAAVLVGRKVAAEAGGDHQVAQVAVEYVGMGLHQRPGAAGRDQRLVELDVVALPGRRLLAAALDHAPLDDLELVVGGDHPPLPPDVARGEGLRHRVALQEQPQLGELAQLGGADRRHLEAALPLRQD